MTLFCEVGASYTQQRTQLRFAVLSKDIAVFLDAFMGLPGQFTLRKISDQERCPQSLSLTVGHMMMPIGLSPLCKGSFFSASKANITSGKEKVSDLPDPVNAIPIMSLPEKLG